MRRRAATALIAATFAVAGCAGVTTSQTRTARPLLNTTTVGGSGYPVVVSGAESVGMTPTAIAAAMRFPAALGPNTSFRTIPPGAAPTTHATLSIQRAGEVGESTLTFLHGERRIGVGTFSMAATDYANPEALGAVTATLISDMLHEAAEYRRDDDTEWVLF